MNETDVKEAILREYIRGKLTINQYRVLIGLCNHGDTDGASKGLAKLLRRQKRERACERVTN